MRLTYLAAGAAITGGLAVGAMGLSAATAAADPGYMPPGPAQPAVPPAGPSPSSAPMWAPAKPAQPAWSNGQAQVWDAGWNHWGVWMNDVFIPTF
jgi:hypothetical protein